MMKKVELVWCLLYGLYVCIGDWLVDQVDHNDYLAGFIGAVFLMLLPWLVGVIDIVMR